ncbi:hypothetical protein [Corynebacterium falsenii]|uniref:hypothetical protein n=1 Tax=Corynebacterium falsenii TaxID=108486 RepID=UPI001D91D3C0|nr:hypothetical protein [Corynebacterium falsenii]HJF12017.1 hypothetical protein [Corynebacterium falsenii]
MTNPTRTGVDAISAASLVKLVESIPGVAGMEAGVVSTLRAIDARIRRRNGDQRARYGLVIDHEQHLVTVEVSLNHGTCVLTVVEKIQHAIKDALRDALSDAATDYTVLVRVQSMS